MLSSVKMLVKEEVGGCALNSHENYIVDHGKSCNCVFEFLWEPCFPYLSSPRVPTAYVFVKEMCLDTRNPVFGVSKNVMLKPAY